MKKSSGEAWRAIVEIGAGIRDARRDYDRKMKELAVVFDREVLKPFLKENNLYIRLTKEQWFIADRETGFYVAYPDDSGRDYVIDLEDYDTKIFRGICKILCILFPVRG